MQKIIQPLLLLVLGLIVAVGVYKYVNTPPVKASAKTNNTVISYPRVTNQSLTLVINAWKLEKDGYTYIESTELCEIANVRLKETKVNWTHEGFKKFTFTNDYNNEYIHKNYWYIIGENLARGYINDQGVLNAWLKSPKHLENLETNYTHICLATDGNYVVAIFGKE